MCRFDVYNLFEKGSGSKINLSKSKGLWLGSWHGRMDPPVPLDWTSGKIKIVGVFLGPEATDKDNWRPRIQAVENVLCSWSQRILSFRGRALVINVLAFSRIWYIAFLVQMPARVLGKLNKLVFHFLER